MSQSRGSDPTQGECPWPVPVHDVCKLLIHLFDARFLPEVGLAAARRKATLPRFIDWLASSFSLVDGDALCTEADVPAETWDFLYRASVQGIDQVVRIVGPVWYHIFLSDRGPPRHPVSALSLVALVHYADGTISPVRVYMSAPRNDIFDATACAAVSSLNAQVLSPFVSSGLDDMYRDGAWCGGPAVLRQLLDVCEQAANGAPAQLANAMRGYMNLIHSLLVDAPCLAAASTPSDQAVPSKAGPEGGFDVPA